MENLLNEIKNQKKIVEKLGFTQFHQSLQKMFYDFIQYPEIASIFDSLENVIKVGELLPARSFSEPVVSTLEEQAAIGFNIILDCTNDDYDVYSISDKYRVTNWSGPDTAERLVKKLKDKYILPFFEFLILILDKQNSEVTVDNEVKKRLEYFSNFYGNDKFTETHEIIIRVKNTFNSDEEIGWNGVANSCRDILISFSNEIKVIFPKIDFSEIKKGNVKEILRTVIYKNKSRYNKTLVDLINSIWNHTNSATHKRDISKEEAKRIYIWTIMIISEIEKILLKYH